HLLEQGPFAGTCLAGTTLFHVDALLSQFRREFGLNAVDGAGGSPRRLSFLLADAGVECLPDSLPVASGVILLGDLEQVLELVLGGLALAADPTVKAVHGSPPFRHPGVLELQGV